jgi:phosphate/sulfate permease
MKLPLRTSQVLLMACLSLLGGCTVVSVTASAVGAAVDVTSSVVGAAVGVTGAAVGGAIDLATDDEDD